MKKHLLLPLLALLLLAGCKKEEASPPPEPPDFSVKAPGSYRGTLTNGSAQLANVSCTVVRAEKNLITISLSNASSSIVFSRQSTYAEGSCSINARLNDVDYRGTASFDGSNFIIDAKASYGSNTSIVYIFNGKK